MSPRSSCPSLFFFTSGNGDQLLGSLGDIVGALYDLLSEELVVHRRGPGLRRGGLATLHLQPGGAGGQQAEGAVDRIQCRPLRTKEGEEKTEKVKRAARGRVGRTEGKIRERETHFREE